MNNKYNMKSTKKKAMTSCDWKKPTSRAHSKRKAPIKNKSRLYKYKGAFSWNGVKIEQYKPAARDWAHVIRKTVIGSRRETTKFHLRYFEIAPRGYTSFEVHRHEHVVIGIRGKGLCILGKKRRPLGFLDILYIEPNTPHQLMNPFQEPFGFFCIVNAKRDRPKILRRD
jgi:ribulose-bisphosphate carboxylase large chain